MVVKMNLNLIDYTSCYLYMMINLLKYQLNLNFDLKSNYQMTLKLEVKYLEFKIDSNN